MRPVAMLFLCLNAAACAATNDPEMTPTIELTPDRPWTDESFQTRILGLDAEASYRLQLEATSVSAGRWISEATFVANRSGVIDLDRDGPSTGSYEGVDAMGLLWSLTWEPVADAPPDYVALDELTVRVLDEDGREVVTRTLLRTSCFERVIHEAIAEDDLRGDRFVPQGSSQGAVLVLGGSEGGRPTLLACALASRGFDTLALAYFGEESLPERLVEIPVEGAERGLDRLRAVTGRDRVAILGASKGAELAALVAAHRSEAVDAVVVYAPSAVVFQGIDERPGQPPRSSWSRAGVGLPFVALDPAAIDFTAVPIEFLDAYRNPLDDPDAIADAVIPVERIEAPVLVVSGDDDRLWPSTLMAQMLLDRREASGAGHARDEHLRFTGAGHRIFAPYWPTTDPGIGIALGGTAPTDAAASADAWPRVLEFLAQ